jgi:diacylglycerol kinase (ATP)
LLCTFESMDANRSTGKDWFVIVNPVGGNGNVRKQWPTIQQALEARGFRLEVAQTSFPLHAVELVEKAVQTGYRQILAVGGDGTNNEVVNGIMRQKEVPSHAITYALLPIGTGNDWIRTHGIPKDVGEWLAMLEAGYTIQQDVGQVEYAAEEGRANRYFANIAGLAYDAYVVSVTERRRRWVVGRFIYLLLVLACLFRYKLRKATLTIDGKADTDRFYTINVGICRYSGGGMQFVPHAVPDNGRFAYTSAGPLSILDVVRATPYFYNGRVGEYKMVKTGEAEVLRVEHPPGEAPTLLEVDGEFLGTTPAVFTILAKALTIVVPESDGITK